MAIQVWVALLLAGARASLEWDYDFTVLTGANQVANKVDTVGD